MRLSFFFFFFLLPLWGQTSPLTNYLILGKDSTYSLGGQIQTDRGYRGFLSLQKEGGGFRGSVVGLVEKKIPPPPSESLSPSEPYLQRGVYLGLQTGFIGIHTRVDGEKQTNWILHVEIHPNKTLYLFSHPEGEKGRKGIGFLTGKTIRLGLEIGKREGSPVPLYDGSVSISIPTNFSTGSIQTTGEVPSPTQSSVALGIHSQPIKKDSLWEEESPYEEEAPEREPIRFLPGKGFPIDYPLHKEKPQLPLTLDELLRKKIPLSESLIIQREIQKKDSLETLKKKLPKSTVTKLQQLLREKWGGFQP
jgi:hypothetical protein